LTETTGDSSALVQVLGLSPRIKYLGNGWSEDTAYDTRYLKIGGAAPATGDAANLSHTHTAGTFITSTESATWGNGGYHATGYKAPHTHSVILSSDSSDLGTPPSITFRLVKKVLGKMKSYNSAILSAETAGTWTAPSQQINADTLLDMYWNEDIEGADTVLVHTRTGATQSACEAASWSAGLTNPNGSLILSSAADWLQYKIEFTATDTTVSNPRVYFTNGYVVKYEYHGGVTIAETAVNFKYSTGDRNYSAPSLDKVFKKIVTTHNGTLGSFIVRWTTENSTGSFTIPLDEFPIRWDSYFQDDAMGQVIDFSIEKNDLNPFKLSEFRGHYSPYNIIV